MAGTGPLNLSHFDRSIDDVKAMVADIMARLRELETREAGNSPLISSQIAALWRQTDEHKAKIALLEKTTLEQAGALRSAMWIVTLLGGATLLYLMNSVLKIIFPTLP